MRNKSRNMSEKAGIVEDSSLVTRKGTKRSSKCWIFLKENMETCLLIVGVAAGIGAGLGLRSVVRQVDSDKLILTPRTISYIAFPGELFLSMLKGLTVPLIMSSLITAVGSMNVRLMGKMGGKAVLYYTITTLLATTLSILVSVNIQPGKRIGIDPILSENISGTTEVTEIQEINDNFGQSLTQDSIMDIFRQMFPPNLFQATMETYRTKLELPPGANESLPLEDYTLNGEFIPGVNILGLLVFSIALGISFALLGKRAAVALGFIQNFSEAIMIITGWVVRISPIGIFFLLTAEMLHVKDFQAVVMSLGVYLLTTLGSYIIHSCFVLPLIYMIMLRKLPFRFIANMAPAFVLSVGTSSTIATLPLTLKCLEERNKIDKRVTRFILPIGGTVNVDGMALYEGAAVIFIAQMVGANFTIGQTIALCITATAATIGSAAAPQSGLVMIIVVLNAFNLPASSISLIMPIDWILDRLRTIVHVMGDSIGAAIIEHLSKDDLPTLDLEEDEDVKESFLSKKTNENDVKEFDIEEDV